MQPFDGGGPRLGVVQSRPVWGEGGGCVCVCVCVCVCGVGILEQT